MLEVVKHLRVQPMPVVKKASKKKGDAAVSRSSSWENNFWVEGINYLHVARAALDYRAYFDAHLYCDIWTQVMADELLPASDDSNLLDGLVDNLKRGSEGLSLQDVEACQQILYSCSTQLGLDDALNGAGCGSKRQLDDESRIQTLELEHKWAPTPSKKAGEDTMTSMMNTGCYNTMSTYLDGMSAYKKEAANDLSGLPCEGSWRLSRWETAATTGLGRVKTSADNFARHSYQAMQSLFGTNDRSGYEFHLKKARSAARMARRLDGSQLVDLNPAELYPLLSQLR